MKLHELRAAEGQPENRRESRGTRDRQGKTAEEV